MTFKEKLQAIREQMSADGVDAYVIPSADPHISEYLPDHYKSISYATGFKGSVSTVVITQEFAGLWADSRYFEQAEEQLEGSGYLLVKLKAQHTPEYITWLNDNLTPGAVVAFDEKTVSVSLGELFNHQLAHKKILFKHKDYLQSIWPDRPALPTAAAFLVPDEFAGQSTKDKLYLIRKAMNQHRANYHFISSLDDIAWVFNIRGNDVKYNPVVLSFAIISENEATLYIQGDKLSKEDTTSLSQSGVEISSYDAIGKDLQFLKPESSILIDPRRNCFALYKLIPSSVQIIKETNPSTHLKAAKNNIEIENTRVAMRKDGVAITRFFKWIKESVGKSKITELSAAAQLRSFRAEQEGYFGDSFNTISAYKAHGALPHYASTKESDVEIQAEGLFLVDSGGQYFYGTTDITRVIPLGETSEEERTDYTLVLKGMIEGCRTRFPKGTCGYTIDAITRKPLWDHAINFGHGTGHGVGYFLNVHEGPQVFNPSATLIPIELGMVTSIEPGIYRPGKHGIRIENLVLTIPYETNQFNEFYSFETLTLAPIDTSIIKRDLLELSQINWLNNYHEHVFKTLSPFLNEDESGFLREMTKEI